MKTNTFRQNKNSVRLLPVVLTTIILLVLLTAGCDKEATILTKGTISPPIISPNADGTDDVTRIEFMLHENAVISIMFTDTNGNDYYFRESQRLTVKEKPYIVYFGGVIANKSVSLSGDREFGVLQQVLPDGNYKWIISAQTADGITQTLTGNLTIQDVDTQLPGIRGLSISPVSFTPNQDGISDRVTINFTLDKVVSDLQVYLVGDDGMEHAIPEDLNTVDALAAGWHTFDYDGGIDAGVNPPQDGVYTVYVEAEDLVGQRTVTSTTLEITNAGIPRAYVVNNIVDYSSNTMILEGKLCFTTTVENDSGTYIRTTGPWPGTTYDSDENRNTLGWSDESGVFRIGMDFDTSLTNYPFRWGIGQPDVDLVEIDGYWYLPPQARSVVTGCVRIVDIPVRNPLYYWLGLIHEDVEIAETNNRIDPIFVTIWEP